MGGCGDDHDGGSTPKVSGRDPGSIGGHEGIGAGKLLAGGGLNSGRFGGSHAIAPMRLAGIGDQKAAKGSGGIPAGKKLPEPALPSCAPDEGCPVPGAADDGGTNQSSIPSEGGGSGNSLGWTVMCGIARIRAHCAGSVGSNGSSGSNGIGSPACAGGENEKGSRGGEPLFGRSRSRFAADAARGAGQRPKRLRFVIDGKLGRLRPSAMEQGRRRHRRGRNGGLRADQRCGLQMKARGGANPPYGQGQMKKPGTVSHIAKSGLPDLRTHKKTDLGQARDRRTLREFQFHE